MGFFDFLAHDRHYAIEPQAIERLNLRHHMIVEPLLPLIMGRSVIEIGARDGRWAYAFAKAGAACVTALEERYELIRRFEDFPDAPFKSCVKMKCTDVFNGLEYEAALRHHHEIVAIMGSFHRITDHLRLLRLVRKLAPKVIIIDGALALNADPVISLCESEGIDDMDALTSEYSRRNFLIRLPSQTALKAMAQSVGYQCDWIDWDRLGPVDRQPVPEYFQNDGNRRFTCLMHTL